VPAYTNTRIAAGTINPFTFLQSGANVTGVANNPNQVELQALQCTGAGVEIIGIGAEFTNAPNGLVGGPSTVPAATTGQQIKVYGDGEETIIMVGSGYNVVQDQLLTSDASGNAIPANVATASTQWIGARAIEAGIAGSPIRVSVVLRGPYKAT